MSSEENGHQKPAREKDVDLLLQYAGTLSKNFEEIMWVFGDTFGSDRTHNNYSDYVSTMSATLRGYVDEGDEQDVARSLINCVLNFQTVREDFVKSNEKFAENLEEIQSKFGLDIQRRIQKVEQGHDYWSNIKSDVGIRSDKPKLRNELIIDYSDRLVFDSSLNGGAILARHFIEQVSDAPDALGRDVLTYIEKSEIERINEISESLLEEMEDLEGGLTSDTQSSADSEESAPDEFSDS